MLLGSAMLPHFLRLRGRGLLPSLARFYWFFGSCLWVELSGEGRKHFAFTKYRGCVLTCAFLIVPTLMMWNHLGFFLDDILFPAWAFEEVEKPLFIVGNARSGTTWFHRLLMDADNGTVFTSLRTWEIVFAQSTTWKVLFLSLYGIDKSYCRGLIYQLLMTVDDIVFGGTKVHPIGLHLHEEDEWLMVSIGLSQLIMFVFPMGGHLLDPLVMFDHDDAVPSALREEIFSFYKDCVKRHLYSYRLLSKEEGHGRVKVFVSKNPPFTMRLQSLMRAFPDARVACLVREPIHSVPSMVSYVGMAWNTFASPTTKYPKAEDLVGFCEAHYKFPKKCFGSSILPDHYTYIDYEKLKSRPSTEVLRALARLYTSTPSTKTPRSPSRWLAWQAPDVHAEHMMSALEAEDAKAAAGEYQSSHRYTLEEVTGMTEEELRRLLEGVYRESQTTTAQ